MKTMKCDMCDVTAQGETFEGWMDALKPHYADAHAEVMQEGAKLPKEEQMKKMQEWMEENKKRFEEAASE